MAQNMLRVAELEEQLRINEQSLYVMDRSETAKRQQLVAEIRRLDVAITRLKREDNARARVQGRGLPFPDIDRNNESATCVAL
ncbi:hypothetical protein BOX15_Mlig011577g3 [Macrostomum lignano]|uniref:Uncharacterized protein n=1 Tax=Macrostomum lignano TaxID=282301 RepID=A0A267H590_9PLAT|nr:hypothetical protein BOX15_Mlig011577g1 [Macrostomum lignano]PAA92722.1 hypothetical protein BOX15_Mlig011577g3 [Macrostomum lignano]